MLVAVLMLVIAGFDVLPAGAATRSAQQLSPIDHVSWTDLMEARVHVSTAEAVECCDENALAEHFGATHCSADCPVILPRLSFDPTATPRSYAIWQNARLRFLAPNFMHRPPISA